MGFLGFGRRPEGVPTDKLSQPEGQTTTVETEQTEPGQVGEQEVDYYDFLKERAARNAFLGEARRQAISSVSEKNGLVDNREATAAQEQAEAEAEERYTTKYGRYKASEPTDAGSVDEAKAQQYTDEGRAEGLARYREMFEPEDESGQPSLPDAISIEHAAETEE